MGPRCSKERGRVLQAEEAIRRKIWKWGRPRLVYEQRTFLSGRCQGWSILKIQAFDRGLDQVSIMESLQLSLAPSLYAIEGNFDLGPFLLIEHLDRNLGQSLSLRNVTSRCPCIWF